MAGGPWAWLDAVLAPVLALVLSSIARALAWARPVSRFVGQAYAQLSEQLARLPRMPRYVEILVAAVLVVVGYRLVKRTGRFVLEVALVSAAAAAAAALLDAAQPGFVR